MMLKTNRAVAAFLLCLFLASLVPSSIATHEQSTLLTSETSDGIWVNDTLEISGRTTLPAQAASWVLYDITDPYSEWEVLRQGDYFSEVTPLGQDLWEWSITIDTLEINCICWLEISQPNGLEREFLNRIVFIGEGPHDPIIRPDHDNLIIADEPVEVSFVGILAEGSLDDTTLHIEWCSAPTGACVGNSSEDEVIISWDGNYGTFSINSTENNLSDGKWNFDYYLRDALLRESPVISLILFVDNTDPIASLSAPVSANESEVIIIDGTESRDGVWGVESLQVNWYITPPSGNLMVAENNEANELLLNLSPNESGIWTVRLDVTDMVGRQNSSEIQIQVNNIAPIISLMINGLDATEITHYEFTKGEDMILDSSFTSDTNFDNLSLSHSWVIGDDEISNTSILDLSKLDPGAYSIKLIVTDNDGLTDNISISIEIKENVVEENDFSFNLGAFVLILVLIGGLILFVRNSMIGKDIEKTMPKWSASKSSKYSDGEKNSSEDADLWQESGPIDEGDD